MNRWLFIQAHDLILNFLALKKFSEVSYFKVRKLSSSINGFIIWGGGMIKSQCVQRVHKIIRISPKWRTHASNAHLLFGEEPWIDQTFCTCIKNSEETRGKKSREKSCFIVNGKLKENGYSTCHEREKKDDISLPYKDSRVLIKLLFSKPNPTKPGFGSNLGLFNVLVLEIPTIHKNTDLQMHKNSWKEPEKIGTRNADEEAQQNPFISIEKGASDFMSLTDSRRHFFDRPQNFFTFYFTIKGLKFLKFFILSKLFNFYSIGPPDRFSFFSSNRREESMKQRIRT